MANDKTCYDEMEDQSCSPRKRNKTTTSKRKKHKLKLSRHHRLETSSSISSEYTDEEVPCCNDRRNSDDTRKDKTDSIDILPSADQLVGLDCEMVGVGKSKRSALARVSIVSYDGVIVYDKYVRPDEEITDYRTRWSGIRKSHMKQAISMTQARQEVLTILRDKIVIGHGLKFDFEVLQFQLPSTSKRDTANYLWLRRLADVRPCVTPSLKTLARIILNKTIQTGEHCSVEDARTAMQLYRLVSNKWELDLKQHSKSFMEDEYWPMKLLNQTGSINNIN